MDEQTNTTNSQEGGSGPIVGSIIIILIIVLGGWYFLSQKTAVDDGMTGDEIRQEQDDVTLNLGTQGSTDEIDDIEEDLENTNLDDLDADLGNIDAELGL